MMMCVLFFRQTCIPGHGEVDAILEGFAKAQNLKYVCPTVYLSVGMHTFPGVRLWRVCDLRI